MRQGLFLSILSQKVEYNSESVQRKVIISEVLTIIKITYLMFSFEQTRSY